MLTISIDAAELAEVLTDFLEPLPSTNSDR